MFASLLYIHLLLRFQTGKVIVEEKKERKNVHQETGKKIGHIIFLPESDYVSFISVPIKAPLKSQEKLFRASRWQS